MPASARPARSSGRHCTQTSRTGRTGRGASACMKRGVSATRRRTYTPTSPRGSAARKAIRHHPDWSSPEVVRRMRPPTPKPSATPSARVAVCHDATIPRRRLGACSAMKTAARPSSPPAASPWVARRTTRSTPALTPIRACPGSTPIAAVAHAHDQDHRGQQPLPPSHVAEASDEHGAEGPRQERRGVDGERGEQEIGTLLRGEEDLHQHDPERAEDREVVPLDDISDAGGDERPARRDRHGEGGGVGDVGRPGHELQDLPARRRASD